MLEDTRNVSSMISPRCSIIIRAYNEGRHIGRLLKGIAHQNVNDYEIILVDSGSTDDTLEIASQHPVQVVKIHPEEFTFGFSLNQGLSRARGELAVIVSAHVYPVYPDWLEKLIAPFSDPQVALTYGKQRGDDSTKFSERQVWSQWYPAVSQPRQPYPFCNNANAAIRRSIWQKFPYDETLPGLEDLSWANRIMENGYGISYVADAEVIHVHNETPRGVYNRYRREAMAFKHIFPQERFHFGDFLRLFSSNLINDLWHVAQERLIVRHLYSIIWFRFMQFWGTYQGYRQSGPLTWQLRKTFYYPRGLNSSRQAMAREVPPIRYNPPSENK
jgi:glycosyltransferase involved in cell wall biosynthesis